MSDRSVKEYRKLRKGERRCLAVPAEPWCPITAEMLGSPAYRALSRAARMCLDRLLIAHIETARRENGRLAVSYDQLVLFGVSRKQIRAALDELDALGFVRREAEGWFRSGVGTAHAAEYRLTFDGVVRDDKMGRATNDWKAVDEKAAKRIAGRPPGKRDKTPGNVVQFKAPIKRAA